MSVYPDLAWLGARLGPDDGPLYALIDCARDSRLHGWLRAPGVYSQSLHSGVQALRLERYGPFCTLIEPGRGLAEPWFSDRGLGWREHWGWLFQSRAPLSSIVLHFKKFLRVDSAGGPLYWRFYDPRALCLSLPQLSLQQQAEFFGDCIRRLFCFDARRQNLIELWQQTHLLESALTGTRRLHVRVHSAGLLSNAAAPNTTQRLPA